MRCLDRSLAAVAFLAMFAAALPAAAQQQSDQAVAPQEIQARSLDPHWLPWLGCWELSADAVDYRVVESTGRRVVCVVPRLDGLGVNLTTQIDDKVIADNTVIADGSERPLPETDCSGYQVASWSADGRRLHSSVSATCGEQTRRDINGLSMLVEGGRWVEIQSVSLDGNEQRELVVRHYDRLGDDATRELGYATLDPALAAQAAQARAAAAAPLDVNDIIEAHEVFPVEVVEATILESGSIFALDTDALLRLADAGIEDRVIDLMVAVSFPEQFVVDAGPSYGGGGGAVYGGYMGYYGFYPSCWGRYYSPFYGPYGPSCSMWWDGPYLGWGYYPPYYGGGGYVRPSVPPSGSLYGGKVINGRGYSAAKVAVPLGSPSAGDSLSINRRNSSGGLGYTVRRAVPRGEGGGIRGVFGTKRSGGGGVTRSGGFSKPGGSSGGAAGGSSSGSSAKPRGGSAKPRGGGGGGPSGS